MNASNEHVVDELPRLLTGEADRATVAAVSTHLRSCEDCRDQLVEVIVGHAALASAATYAPRLVDPELTGAPRLTDSAPEFPIDLSAVFAQIRSEVEVEEPAAAPADDLTARRRSNNARRNWLIAAAAVVVLGGGAGTYLATSGGSSHPVTRDVALAAFDQGTTTASAQMIGGDELSLDASSLPQLPVGHYYEVWLTNPARTSMAPIGLLDADRKADFTVPASEMSAYAAVEVSVQDTAGQGAFSGESVLRGSYA